MPHAFSERLGEGPLLCDGAMGTVLYARGVALDACFDVLNLNNPRLVQGVHADYIAAGADCIETNTFGANRFKLAVHGLENQTREVNRRGVRLARDVRESAGRDVWVLGSIGPLGKYLEPLGTLTADEAREAFREQAEALLEGGADAFVVETFSDLAEIRLAIEAIRSVTDLPIVAQMAFTDEAVTFMGRAPAEVARDLRGLGVQAIGANCSVGSSTLYDVLERMAPEAGGSPVPVLVGILPLHSSRHAEFLHNEVPGITIPDGVRARMRQAGESALRAGIEMAQELVNDVRARYAGAYLMPSFGRFEVVAEVLDVLH